MESLMKPAAIQVVLLVFQACIYFGIQKFEGPAHDVESRFDRRIPCIPEFIFIYVSWFPLIGIFPLILFHCSFFAYAVYMASMLLDLAISVVIYIAYPSSFTRPVPPDTFCGRLLAIAYRCDYKGKNCMPSLHCSLCFIMVFSTLSCSGMDPFLAAGLCILNILIIFSTVLTKQHVIVDVVTAGLLASMCYGCGYGFILTIA